MRWDPDRYLEFSDDRLRPAIDLLARVPVDAPGSVWDLGCGTGLVTELLAERWPHADITGMDSSEEMLEVARRRTDIRWVTGDITDWDPPEPADVAVCNAVLQWVDGHTALLPRLMAATEVLAVQMPRNFAAPSHTVLAETAASPRWRDRVGHLRRDRPVADPAEYYDALAPVAGRVDLWETEYVHLLTGDDPVPRWVSGTAARPHLEILGDDGPVFLSDYAERVRAAYPRRSDGTTLFAFRRIFIVATR